MTDAPVASHPWRSRRVVLAAPAGCEAEAIRRSRRSAGAVVVPQPPDDAVLVILDALQTAALVEGEVAIAPRVPLHAPDSRLPGLEANPFAHREVAVTPALADAGALHRLPVVNAR